MQLTLRQIEVFRALMRCRTVVGAAKELRIAQPTVTKTIRRIEDVCALALFDRHRGRLVPTAEAHRLLGEVDLAFEQLEGALARALRFARADGGSLGSALRRASGASWSRCAAADLLQEHPGLSLHIDILSVSQVMEYLLSGTGRMRRHAVPDPACRHPQRSRRARRGRRGGAARLAADGGRRPCAVGAGRPADHRVRAAIRAWPGGRYRSAGRRRHADAHPCRALRGDRDRAG